MLRALVATSLVVLTTACGPLGTAAPSSPTRFKTYQYVLDVPTRPVNASERLTLDWRPQLASQSSPDPYEIELCVAFFGPWSSVEALKREARPDARPSCPPTGAVATSEVLRTSSNAGGSLTTTLTAPSAKGFYDVRQISIFGGGNTMSAGGIIEVR